MCKAGYTAAGAEQAGIASRVLPAIVDCVDAYHFVETGL